jgi:hypothetical protein
MKANRSKWVQKIHNHAMARYDKGWDCIVECYHQEKVLELLDFLADETVKNYDDAIVILGRFVKMRKEQESNCAWGEW